MSRKRIFILLILATVMSLLLIAAGPVPQDYYCYWKKIQTCGQRCPAPCFPPAGGEHTWLYQKYEWTCCQSGNCWGMGEYEIRAEYQGCAYCFVWGSTTC